MPHRRTHRVLFVTVVLLLFVLGVALYLLLPQRRPARPADMPSGPTGTVNILIIGKDARAVGPVINEGRQRNRREERSHSDVIIVCHINFSTRALSLVAIPRDMLVQAPGITRAASPTDFTHMEKIANTYAIGREPLLRRTVEHLLGIKIQRYIAFDFDSFRMAFDVLRPFLGVLRVGGVNITERGQALMFARKRRGLPFDDIDRGRNAVSLVRGITARTWWLAGTRLGSALLQRLLAVVGQDTDLSRAEAEEIAAGLKAVHFNPANIGTAVLVGQGADVTLSRYNQTLSCYLPVYREIEKQAAHYLLDQPEVQAMDFMTQENFRVPSYLVEDYVTPGADSMVDSLPFDTAGMDSQRVSTRLLELQQIRHRKDSSSADTSR